MQIKFKDVPEGFYKAKVSKIKEENGSYGPFLRIIFSITEGELTHYRFSGFVKPTPIKQSKFYKWITQILGEPPDDEFCTEDMIGKECMIYLMKQNKYYTVYEVSKRYDEKLTLQAQLPLWGEVGPRIGD